MMSKKQQRIDMERRYDERMADSYQVEVVPSRTDDRWQVRCYDHHGFFIGGLSGASLEDAQNEAHYIAIRSVGVPNSVCGLSEETS